MQEDTFVHWSEGAEILGVKRNAFFYLVESGQVRVEPGRKPRDGRYSLQDILKVKEKREQKKPRKPHRKKLPPTAFDWLRWDDLPASLRLDQLVYGEEVDLGEVSIYQGWRKKNPNTSIAAFDAKDRSICLGYCGLVPVSEQTCIDVLAGRRSETTITADDIEAYDRPGGYTLYAISAVVHPDRPDLLFQLLSRYMAFWVEQYPERYIRKIYALAVSEQGEMLVQHFFMAPRPDLAYNAYELDLARPSASKIIKRFMNQLKAKAPLPPDLHWPPLA
jgi:hypothetical protein